MKQMFVLMNKMHQLTDEQKEAAVKEFGITEFVFLPSELAELFSNVPTNLRTLHNYVIPFFNFIVDNYKEDDVVFLTGEQGLVVELFNQLRNYEEVDEKLTLGFKIVYSTTNRIVEETKNSDGIVTKKSMFKHVLFREM